MLTKLQGFCGGLNQGKDRNFAIYDTLNLYMETSSTKSEDAAMSPTPGFKPFYNFGTERPVAQYVSSWGEYFVITELGNVYRKYGEYTNWQKHIQIVSPGSRITFCDLQHYCFICDQNYIYMLGEADKQFNKRFTPGSYTGDRPELTIPFYPKLVAAMGQFLLVSGNDYEQADGMDLDSAGTGNRVFIMNPENFNKGSIPWNDIAPVTFSGGITDMLTVTGLLFLFSKVGIEAWYPNGSSLNDDGTYTNNPLSFQSSAFTGAEGVINELQVATNKTSIFWLGTNGLGSVGCYCIRDFNSNLVPEKVSLPSLDEELMTQDLQSATVDCFSYHSHPFFVLKTLTHSYIFDLLTSAWTRFESLDEWQRLMVHPLKNFVAFGTHVIGFNGTVLYEVGGLKEIWRKADGSEDSRLIRRKRVGPMLWSGNSRCILDCVHVDMQGGLTDDLDIPQRIRLRLSQDKYTWGDYYDTELGNKGQYTRTAQFRRLGAGLNGLVAEVTWDDRCGAKLLQLMYQGRISSKNA